MNSLTLYLKDVWDELLYRVTWPTWPELQSSGIVVIIASLMIALSVFLMDFVFGSTPENPFFKGALYWVYKAFASFRG